MRDAGTQITYSSHSHKYAHARQQAAPTHSEHTGTHNTQQNKKQSTVVKNKKAEIKKRNKKIDARALGPDSQYACEHTDHIQHARTHIHTHANRQHVHTQRGAHHRCNKIKNKNKNK